MYAVIRAGGKQYRVAPGDVIRIEKVTPADGERDIQFNDVLLVSASEGQLGRPQGEARVVGRVVGQGRADKVLVFHYKRKKQYKKLRGHRQPFTAVRITEIAFDGERFIAPEQPEPAPEKEAAGRPKVTAGGAAAEQAVAPSKKAKAARKKATSGAAKGAGSHTQAQFGGATKTTGSKSKGGKPPAPKKK
jgi:large subunit ribosomal protein L21